MMNSFDRLSDAITARTRERYGSVVYMHPFFFRGIEKTLPLEFIFQWEENQSFKGFSVVSTPYIPKVPGFLILPRSKRDNDNGDAITVVERMLVVSRTWTGMGFVYHNMAKFRVEQIAKALGFPEPMKDKEATD